MNSKSETSGNLTKLKTNILFYIFIILEFYILPLAITDTGSGMFFLLLVFPILTFIAAIIYGLKNGFRFYFPLFAVLLFVPSIFIYYNSSAAIYVVGYGVAALIGVLIGAFFHKILRK